MRNKPDRLWMSIAILLVLAIYIGGYEIFWKTRKSAAEKEAKRIVPFKSEDIQTIAIKKGKTGEEIWIQRRGDDWKIIKPKEFEAEPTEVGFLVDRLASFSYTEEIKGGKDEDYGLTSPRLTVEVTSRTGSIARFQVGNDTPVGFSMYVKKGSKTLVADQGIYRDLDKPLNEFRRKKLFSFITPDVNSVELMDRAAGTRIVLTRREGAWRITEPIDYPADRNTVENTLRSIEFAEFADFVAEGTSLESLGLQPPMFTTIVKIRSPDETSKKDHNNEKKDTKPVEEIQEAYFGKEDPGRWYAVRKNSEEIGYISPDRKKDIFKKVDDFKRKTLADFSEFDVTYIKAVFGKETSEFERSGKVGAEKWFVKGTRREVAFSDIGYIFDFVTGTRFDTAVEIKENAEKFGLDHPKARLLLKDESGKTLGEIIVGEKEGKYFASLMGENIAFEIREDQFKSLESKIRLMKTPAGKEK
ncbi:MAG: DUF4340 domain-containing protein [bacterium JZ-2024 1]